MSNTRTKHRYRKNYRIWVAFFYINSSKVDSGTIMLWRFVFVWLWSFDPLFSLAGFCYNSLFWLNCDSNLDMAVSYWKLTVLYASTTWSLAINYCVKIWQCAVYADLLKFSCHGPLLTLRYISITEVFFGPIIQTVQAKECKILVLQEFNVADDSRVIERSTHIWRTVSIVL